MQQELGAHVAQLGLHVGGAVEVAKRAGEGGVSLHGAQLAQQGGLRQGEGEVQRVDVAVARGQSVEVGGHDGAVDVRQADNVAVEFEVGSRADVEGEVLRVQVCHGAVDQTLQGGRHFDGPQHRRPVGGVAHAAVAAVVETGEHVDAVGIGRHGLPVAVAQQHVAQQPAVVGLQLEVRRADAVACHVDVALELAHVQPASLGGIERVDAAGDVVGVDPHVAESGPRHRVVHLGNVHAVLVWVVSCASEVHVVAHVAKREVVDRDEKAMVWVRRSGLLRREVVDDVTQVELLVLVYFQVVVGVAERHAVQSQSLTAHGKAVERAREATYRRDSVAVGRHEQDVVQHDVAEHIDVHGTHRDASAPLPTEVAAGGGTRQRLHYGIVQECYRHVEEQQDSRQTALYYGP